LFGIPRALQGDHSEQSQKPSDGSSAQLQARYGANTNLEQISDWLTKILVGVGLTQITKLPAALALAAEFVGRAMVAVPASEIPSSSARGVACASLVYFPICGFLFSYLWSRIYLAGALAHADVSAQLARVEQKVDAQARQADLDAQALGRLARQLNPDPSDQPVPEKDLIEAIKQASPTVRVQVFYQAERVRSANWNGDKALMERTIPLFLGLVASDPEGRFHRNYGQLGYALKDQRSPQWEAAERALTTAIRIRDSVGESQWYHLYEFNRAVCRIMHDPDFSAQRQASGDLRAAVLGDLSVLRGREKGLVTQEPVRSWLKLNRVTADGVQETDQ
jgi:hypothetical protein